MQYHHVVAVGDSLSLKIKHFIDKNESWHNSEEDSSSLVGHYKNKNAWIVLLTYGISGYIANTLVFKTAPPTGQRSVSSVG